MMDGAMLAVLERIERRLEALEDRLEASTSPRALKQPEAARMLGVSSKTLRRMIRTAEISTVPIAGRRHVPLTEIVRLTSVSRSSKATPMRLTPDRVRASRSGEPYDAKAEAERARAMLRKKR